MNFLVQLFKSRNGNLTRLMHTLFKVITLCTLPVDPGRFHMRQHIQKNANRVSCAACLELVQIQTQTITSQERNASLLWMPGGVDGDRERCSDGGIA